MADTATQIIPYIFYRDVPAALEWLARAFGFVEVMREATPNGGMHAEMTLGGQMIMLGQRGAAAEAGVAGADKATQGIFVYLPEVDDHCARARAAGADVVAPPRDLPYGRSYTAHDIEGHPWFFTTPPA